MNSLDQRALERVADEVLLIIRKKPKQFMSYESLARTLKVDSAVIEDALRELVTLGYRLRRRRREAVAFIEPPDSLTAVEIQHNLKTKMIGRTAYCYRQVKSTNDLAALMADAGSHEGAIVTAEQQSAGRGRLGRTWHSPFGAGIYVSILLRPKFPPDRAPGISMMTALALADCLDKYVPNDVTIKWPNDILVGGRKVAGILTELSAERDKINHVIVGVGINVNHGKADFPAVLSKFATSLRMTLKRKISRPLLLREFLHRFEFEYLAFQKSGLKKSQNRLRAYSSLLGRQVKLVSGSHITVGTALDIDINGALILEKDGNRTVVSAGEVSVVKD